MKSLQATPAQSKGHGVCIIVIVNLAAVRAAQGKAQQHNSQPGPVRDAGCIGTQPPSVYVASLNHQ